MALKQDERECNECRNEDNRERAAVVQVETPMHIKVALCDEHWTDYLKTRLGNTFRFLKERAHA